MLLINCEINHIITWSANCVIAGVNRVRTLAITDTKLYVPAGALSTNDNGKLLQELKWGFKGPIKWNKYQSKVRIQQWLLNWSKFWSS